MAPQKLIESSLSQFAAQLAERTPTPGGGSMAAYLAASGAALVAMACRFTSGDKFAAVQAAATATADALDELRPAALGLVDRDARAYDAVTAALAMPKSTDAEKQARSAAMQQALRGALEVPFETLVLAVRGLELAAPLAPGVNPNLASDCGVGARCLQGAAEGAFLNVRINARSIKDAEYAKARLAEAERLRDRARELGDRVVRAVESLS